MQPLTSLRALGVGFSMLGIVALTGCGTSGGGTASAKVASLNGGSSTTAAKASSPADFRKAVLAYAKCMRDKGVNFPDPTFDANGRPQFAERPGGGEGPGAANRDNPAFQKARQACRPILDQARASFQPTPQQLAQTRKNLLAFAKCMRGQGINYPDPTFDANGRPQFGQHSANGETREVPNDPKTQKAFQTCRQQVGAGGGDGGPGFGFGFGGGGGAQRPGA